MIARRPSGRGTRASGQDRRSATGASTRSAAAAPPRTVRYGGELAAALALAVLAGAAAAGLALFAAVLCARSVPMFQRQRRTAAARYAALLASTAAALACGLEARDWLSAGAGLLPGF